MVQFSCHAHVCDVGRGLTRTEDDNRLKRDHGRPRSLVSDRVNNKCRLGGGELITWGELL